MSYIFVYRDLIGGPPKEGQTLWYGVWDYCLDTERCEILTAPKEATVSNRVLIRNAEVLAELDSNRRAAALCLMNKKEYQLTGHEFKGLDDANHDDEKDYQCRERLREMRRLLATWGEGNDCLMRSPRRKSVATANRTNVHPRARLRLSPEILDEFCERIDLEYRRLTSEGEKEPTVFVTMVERKTEIFGEILSPKELDLVTARGIDGKYHRWLERKDMKKIKKE